MNNRKRLVHSPPQAPERHNIHPRPVDPTIAAVTEPLGESPDVFQRLGEIGRVLVAIVDDLDTVLPVVVQRRSLHGVQVADHGVGEPARGAGARGREREETVCAGVGAGYVGGWVCELWDGGMEDRKRDGEWAVERKERGGG